MLIFLVLFCCLFLCWFSFFLFFSFQCKCLVHRSKCTTKLNSRLSPLAIIYLYVCVCVSIKKKTEKRGGHNSLWCRATLRLAKICFTVSESNTESDLPRLLGVFLASNLKKKTWFVCRLSSLSLSPLLRGHWPLVLSSPSSPVRPCHNLRFLLCLPRRLCTEKEKSLTPGAKWTRRERGGKLLPSLALWGLFMRFSQF